MIFPLVYGFSYKTTFYVSTPVFLEGIFCFSSSLGNSSISSTNFLFFQFNRGLSYDTLFVSVDRQKQCLCCLFGVHLDNLFLLVFMTFLTFNTSLRTDLEYNNFDKVTQRVGIGIYSGHLSDLQVKTAYRPDNTQHSLCLFTCPSIRQAVFPDLFGWDLSFYFFFCLLLPSNLCHLEKREDANGMNEISRYIDDEQ